MQEITLDAQVRSEMGKSKAKSLRDNGFIPAVVYSAGKDTQSLKLSRHDFLRFIHQYHLESTVISLKIKGQKSRAVLVKDVQYEPVKEDIIHIDFQEISLTSKIKVNVRVMAKGEPVGVKVDGGTLNHLLWELEVECLPKKIPEDIPVDVSQLKIGDVIYVRDLSLSPDVKVINDPESIVFSVEPPIKEEEIIPAVPAEGEEPAEPEVIKERKEVPEEGAEEEKKEEKEAKEKKQEKEEGSSKK